MHNFLLPSGRTEGGLFMSVHMIYYKDGAKMMRPVLTAAEYRNLRNGQRSLVAAIRQGDTSLKQRLIQMNYSCLPNDDGSLKGSTRLSTSVGMDIDHIAQDQMEATKERIMAKKDELGLLMLELSARGEGYHLVFRRRPSMSQEENLRWASRLLGVEYDKGAKDITRVFFTTSAGPEDLIFLDDEIFRTLSPEPSPLKGEGEERKTPNNLEVSPRGDLEGVTPLPKREGKGESLCFRGIPYSSIIEEYWSKTGGEPVEGERNVRLHQLAVNLRAICDNKKDLLMQIMPRLGLSEEELRSIVDSACKEPPKGVSKTISSIIQDSKFKIQNEEEELDEEENDSSSLPLREGKGVGPRLRLPIGLKESLVGVPESMHMPVLCAVLPIAAAYADQVEVEYCDGMRHRLGLMSIIRGEQASNKSICKTAVDVWKRQFDQEDALARQREDEWKEQRKRRKANEKAPEDPHVLIRMVPVTVSCSTLLKRLKNAQGHTLYSFGEELDTLRKTNGAGSWSSKYDIYRMGFDHGEWGQDYNSDQAESGVVQVAYNWTMLGTYGAVRRCFKSDNIENGLSSRVLMAEMPDGAFAKLTKFSHRSEDDEARIQEAVTKLRSYSGFIDTPRLRKAIEKWVESKRQEAAKNIDYVMDTYRKRAAVIGFRCGVIHFLLSQENEKLKMKNEKLNDQCSMFNVQCRESKASLDFALKIADYCLEQQMKAFGETLQSGIVSASQEGLRNTKNHNVFDQLPPVFTMGDLRALKQGEHTPQALNMVIYRWKRDGWIEKIDAQHWRKSSNSK